MKSLYLSAVDYEKSFLFQHKEIKAGMKVSAKMEAKPSPIPKDLENYFKKVGKGAYFSITKRAQIKGSPIAKKGVESLQRVFQADIFDKTEAALKDKNSEFRKLLEKNTESDTGGSIFAKSLASFDKKGVLFKQVDGDYGHSTRLAVAYLQYLVDAKVDGVFGKEIANPGSMLFDDVVQRSDGVAFRGKFIPHRTEPVVTILNDIDTSLRHDNLACRFRQDKTFFVQEGYAEFREDGWEYLVPGESEKQVMESAQSIPVDFRTMPRCLDVGNEDVEASFHKKAGGNQAGKV